ncbi:hypothetical protein K502DRAFT_317479 [Neoconidiobolus thromboides FSU 785]|nr:hypothetical protein K502DRAFT_317479 [Neoconidiobolus thromboides FSU 785]
MEAIQNSIASAEGLSRRGQPQRAFRLFLVTLINLTHELMNLSIEFPLNPNNDKFEQVKKLFQDGDFCLSQARNLCLYFDCNSSPQERPFSMMEISPHLPSSYSNHNSPIKPGLKLGLPKIPPKSPSRLKSKAYVKLSSLVNGNEENERIREVPKLDIINENHMASSFDLTNHTLERKGHLGVMRVERLGVPLEISKSTPADFNFNSNHKNKRHSGNIKLSDFSPNELRKKLDAAFNPFSKRSSQISTEKDTPSISSLKDTSNSTDKDSPSSSGPPSPITNGTPTQTLKPSRLRHHRRTTSEESRISFAEIIKTASSAINIDFMNEKKENEASETVSSPNLDNTPLNFELDPEDLAPAKMLNSEAKVVRPLSIDSITALGRIPLIPRSPLVVALQKATRTLSQAKQDLKELAYDQRNGMEDLERMDKLRETISNSSATFERISKLIRVDNSATFTFFPAALVAYQLTLIEWEIFKKIPPEAIELHSFKNPYPQISISTDFFNYLTRVIELSILQAGQDRVEMIHFWIKCANKLMLLYNFQTLKAVLSALNTPPIKRLKHTWSHVLKKDHTLLNSMNELMGESNNYYSYRQHVQKLGVKGNYNEEYNKPIIPYLGVFLMDMTYLKAANKDDKRIQELVTQFQIYLNGPDYLLTPPHRFIKSRRHQKSTSFSSFSLNFGKSIHNTPSQSPLPFLNSLSTELDQSPYQKKPLKDKVTLSSFQQLITHFLLNQVWANEKVVDQLAADLISNERKVTKQISKSQTSIPSIKIKSSNDNYENKVSFLPSPVTPSNSTTLLLDPFEFEIPDIEKTLLADPILSEDSSSL